MESACGGATGAGFEVELSGAGAGLGAILGALALGGSKATGRWAVWHPTLPRIRAAAAVSGK